MDEVHSLTLVIKQEKRPIVEYRSEYNVNMWLEVKKRWMVFGVLLSVALAVLCPRVGAPGGALHTEVLSWAALGALCFSSGQETGVGAVRAVRVRLCAILTLHAHLAAPAIAAASALAFRDVRLDRRLIEGALVLCSRGPCGWLALALCRGSSAAPALAAINYLVSLVATPLALKFFCGETSFPSLFSVMCTTCVTVGPFLLGSWWGGGAGVVRGPASSPKAARAFIALLLLYIDCCALLHEAEGALHVTDVLATLFLEFSIVSMTAASSSLYAHYGLLRPRECRALAVAAVPKAAHIGWGMGAGCMASGLARLPAVFLAPTQALLLVALYGATDDGDNSDEDSLDPNR